MKEIKQGFIIFILFSILTGLAYPVFVTGVAQIIWRDNANGSLIRVENKVIGSKLIGQSFTSAKYFHGRPSATDYKGSISGATNLGPTSKKLMEITENEITKLRVENNLSKNVNIPGDLVLSSASGLDPHISPESALLQAQRVAKARGISLENVKQLILKTKEKPQFKILGQRRINVLELNLSLDRIN